MNSKSKSTKAHSSRAAIAKATPARKKVSTKSSKESLEDIFVDILKDMYWAEKYLIRALPKMARAAHHEDLKEGIENHLEETQQQVSRLEKCFEILELKPMGKKCEAMEGLVTEGTQAIEDNEEGHARDAAIIAAAQKIEHYEISAYGTLRSMATVLGKVQCAEVFEEIKNEEAQTDIKLSELAEKINPLAAEVETEEVA